MADLTYTIKTGTVNGTTEFNTIRAATQYFLAGDRMGAGTGTVAAASTLYYKVQGFLTLTADRQYITGLTLANSSTSKIILEADTNPWNASTSNVAGYTTSYDGFDMGSFDVFGALQAGLTIRNLVISSAVGIVGSNGVINLTNSNATARAYLLSCIVRTTATAAPCVLQMNANCTAANNILILSSSSQSGTPKGVFITSDGEFYGNTLISNSSLGSGIDDAGGAVTLTKVKNNVICGFATPFGGETYSAASVGNAGSSTDTPNSGLQSIALSTTNFISVTSGGDYRVQTTSSLKTTGATVLSSPYDVDAYGQTRSATTTIGAHAAEVSAVTSSPSQRLAMLGIG